MTTIDDKVVQYGTKGLFSVNKYTQEIEQFMQFGFYQQLVIEDPDILDTNYFGRLQEDGSFRWYADAEEQVPLPENISIKSIPKGLPRTYQDIKKLPEFLVCFARMTGPVDTEFITEAYQMLPDELKESPLAVPPRAYLRQLADAREEEQPEKLQRRMEGLSRSTPIPDAPNTIDESAGSGLPERIGQYAVDKAGRLSLPDPTSETMPGLPALTDLHRSGTYSKHGRDQIPEAVTPTKPRYR